MIPHECVQFFVTATFFYSHTLSQHKPLLLLPQPNIYSCHHTYVYEKGENLWKFVFSLVISKCKYAAKKCQWAGKMSFSSLPENPWTGRKNIPYYIIQSLSLSLSYMQFTKNTAKFCDHWLGWSWPETSLQIVWFLDIILTLLWLFVTYN
jgi:hypothetical protein